MHACVTQANQPAKRKREAEGMGEEEGRLGDVDSSGLYTTRRKCRERLGHETFYLKSNLVIIQFNSP